MILDCFYCNFKLFYCDSNIFVVNLSCFLVISDCFICDSRLGIWSIEASYSDEFTTTARTDFEVKEYGKITNDARQPVVVLLFYNCSRFSNSSTQFFHPGETRKKLHQLWKLQKF